MSGQFNKAPLVYVSARIRTTELPELLADQRAALHQAMIRCGLPEAIKSEIQTIEFALEESSAQGRPNTLTRRAFFSADRTQSLIIDRDAIEFRVSAYSKYADFMARYEELISALTGAVDVLAQVACQEYTLRYADVIVPYPGRKLADYFAGDGRILPLEAFFDNNSSLGSISDEVRVGQVQISRIRAKSEKIDLVLEQLPVRDGKLGRPLPMAMVEPDVKFNMPLNINRPEDLSSVSDYALLMTQAAKLDNKELGELDVKHEFSSLHQLTKETFWNLIDESVCGHDWEYIA